MRFDKNGWLTTGAQIEKTASFYASQNLRHIIVMHYTAGFNSSSAIVTFKKQKKPRASAHFVVDVSGTITQMVSTNCVAFHAGGGDYRGKANINSYSLGIEIVNPGYLFQDEDGQFLDWSGTRITKGRLDPFPGVIREYDPRVGRMAFWPNYPPAQLLAVEKLTSAMLKKYPSISDIVGHRDVDNKRGWKVDPGPAFPMLRFRRLLDSREESEGAIYEAVVTGANTLNVRGGPSTSYDKLDWGPLKNGQFVEVHRRDGQWEYVRRYFDGEAQEGWVHSAYLVPR